MKAFLLICSIVLIHSISYSDTKLDVTLAADDWCPFTCDPATPQGKGVLYDVLDEALKGQSYAINYQFINWARATALMKKNKIDGLIGVYETDFPELLLTKHPAMVSQDCFYALSSNQSLKDWTFKKLDSINQLKVGIINGYGYGELIDQFKVSKEGKEKFIEASGDDPLMQNIKKLEKNRVQVILENRMVIDHLRSKNSELHLSEKGCLDPKKIYIGFTNNQKNKDIIKKIDVFLESPHSANKINSIKAKYFK